jgi:hypothetical protein
VLADPSRASFGALKARVRAEGAEAPADLPERVDSVDDATVVLHFIGSASDDAKATRREQVVLLIDGMVAHADPHIQPFGWLARVCFIENPGEVAGYLSDLATAPISDYAKLECLIDVAFPEDFDVNVVSRFIETGVSGPLQSYAWYRLAKFFRSCGRYTESQALVGRMSPYHVLMYMYGQGRIYSPSPGTDFARERERLTALRDENAGASVKVRSAINNGLNNVYFLTGGGGDPTQTVDVIDRTLPWLTTPDLSAALRFRFTEDCLRLWADPQSPVYDPAQVLAFLGVYIECFAHQRSSYTNVGGLVVNVLLSDPQTDGKQLNFEQLMSCYEAQHSPHTRLRVSGYRLQQQVHRYPDEPARHSESMAAIVNDCLAEILTDGMESIYYGDILGPVLSRILPSLPVDTGLAMLHLVIERPEELGVARAALGLDAFHQPVTEFLGRDEVPAAERDSLRMLYLA